VNVRDPVLLERELRRMQQRIDRLERAIATRDGALIGETEHGDRVYAVAPKRAPSKPNGDGDDA
jgi:hypothetical protein